MTFNNLKMPGVIYFFSAFTVAFAVYSGITVNGIVLEHRPLIVKIQFRRA